MTAKMPERYLQIALRWVTDALGFDIPDEELLKYPSLRKIAKAFDDVYYIAMEDGIKQGQSGGYRAGLVDGRHEMERTIRAALQKYTPDMVISMDEVNAVITKVVEELSNK